MAVAFDPRRADDAIKVQQRKPGERLARRDEIDAESEALPAGSDVATISFGKTSEAHPA